MSKLELQSGFPDFFFSSDSRRYPRWAIRRKAQILSEDIRDLSNLQMLTVLEHLALLLPERV